MEVDSTRSAALFAIQTEIGRVQEVNDAIRWGREEDLERLLHRHPTAHMPIPILFLPFLCIGSGAQSAS
jgi:hypothetical protein